ncbi:MAG: efflux RND transporter periplasmic adaptor subunit, partial [Candidatus Aminicenantes bacterium]|nr:efflux RND transporter periplasmic adaptor subunit [Candidatus Aminicenantes bacterium]
PNENIRKSAGRLLNLTRSRLEYWDISKTEIEKIEKTGVVRRTIQLKSQINGVVLHKAVVEGDKVGPGMDLFHIADLSKVWVEAAIYESELPLIKQGQKAEIEMDQLRGKTLDGKVDFIYPYLDQKSRANNVRLVFHNPDLVLKPDMFATVRIYVPAASDSLAVPAESVIYSGKRQIVFVTKGDGKFEPREVKAGIESDDGYVQVVSGLFDGEEVVVSGQFLLDSESRTREAIAKMRAAQAQKKQPASEKEESKDHTHSADEHTHEAQKTEHKIDIDRFYACPMHPEFLTTDPDARCPDCEMKVVPLKELEVKVNLEKAEFYTCPMHPEFLTTDPDARCPECGMKLEKVKK